MKTPTRVRLRVNPILCDGVGYCAEIAPELISLDEWGFPLVASGLLEEPAMLQHARRAVAICPRQALLLEPADQDRSSQGAS